MFDSVTRFRRCDGQQLLNGGSVEESDSGGVGGLDQRNYALKCLNLGNGTGLH